MAFYLLTDSHGRPYLPDLREFTSGAATARVGAELRTGLSAPWHGKRFFVAGSPGRTLPDSPMFPDRHSRLFEVQLPGREAPVRHAGRIAVDCALVTKEVSVFRLFGRQAKFMERFFAGMEAMTLEQWARVHQYFVATELRDVARYGTPGVGRIGRAVKNTAHRSTKLVDELGYLADGWAYELIDSSIPDERRVEMLRASETANVAARALALGDKLLPAIRVDALAPFAAVIGPVWEESKPAKKPPPVVPITPSNEYVQPGREERSCLGI
ncbi:MAG: hypothetical protein M0Z91_13830 [Actinomycetota bacterium]|nr:hypothetical protein [Actinomycetota bacterium]